LIRRNDDEMNEGAYLSDDTWHPEERQHRVKFSPEQIKAIQQWARADAEADWNRLRAAGYSPEQARRIMEELAPERALQSWAAHAQEFLSLAPAQGQSRQQKRWWEFWK